MSRFRANQRLVRASAPLAERHRWRVWRLWWLGAVIALWSATPVPQQIALHVVSAIAEHVNDCADGCGERDCCPAPCESCHCCVHTSAVALAALPLPVLSASLSMLVMRAEDRPSLGFISPPFRPPTA